jgi:hypothetical protein
MGKDRQGQDSELAWQAQCHLLSNPPIFWQTRLPRHQAPALPAVATGTACEMGCARETALQSELPRDGV